MSDPSSYDSRLDAIERELANLTATVEQTDAEVDGIQIQMAQRERAWYTQPPVVLSVLAALVAILSTAYGIFQQREQARHEARAELRTLIEELTSNAELKLRYGTSTIAGYIDPQNLFLASQAEEIINSIPEDVTASEHILVAFFLSEAGDYKRAQHLLERAATKATNAYERVVALRTIAQNQFNSGELEKGRATYQSALQVRESFPGLPPSVYNGLDSQTLVYWANLEASLGQCDHARARLDQAMQVASGLASYWQRQNIETQAAAIKATYKTCSWGAP